MKLIIRRQTVTVRELTLDENFHVTRQLVDRKRKNQDIYTFKECAYCLKRISKDGEAIVHAISRDSLTSYYFHKKCYEEQSEAYRPLA